MNASFDGIQLSRKLTKLFFIGQSIAPIVRHAHVCFLHHPLANLLDHLGDTSELTE